jgi:hypothetical protein
MSSVEYLGFVKVGDRTRLLVRAPEEERDRVKEAHERDEVIFTRAKDMPSLEALLQAHQVDYAVLQLPPPLADGETTETGPDNDWRTQASARLAQSVEQAVKGGAMLHEELSFIPALPADDLDDFLARAEKLLGLPGTTNADWNEFLLNQDRRVAAADPSSVVDSDEVAASEDGAAPLLTASDLSLAYTRGAIGGPRPLVDSN